MDGALDIDRPCLLDFLFVHLPLNGLSDVEEAVVALEELDVVQDRITVTQRDLGVQRHDLNMRRVLTLVLIDLRTLSRSGHGLTALHAFDNDNRIPQASGFVDDQFLRFPLGCAAHLRILADFSRG